MDFIGSCMVHCCLIVCGLATWTAETMDCDGDDGDVRLHHVIME